MMTLDSKHELCGRQLKVGRTKGYVPAGGVAAAPIGGGFKVPGQYTPQGFRPGSMSMGGADKKQRDVYVGNLLQNVVTPEMISEYFTAQLGILPGYEPSTGPVILNVAMGGMGKFAFLEMRDTTLADYMMTLDNKLELCGRSLKLGRAKGYVPGGGGAGPSPMSAYQPQQQQQYQQYQPQQQQYQQYQPQAYVPQQAYAPQAYAQQAAYTPQQTTAGGYAQQAYAPQAYPQQVQQQAQQGYAQQAPQGYAPQQGY